jgi:hypothetical protein
MRRLLILSFAITTVALSGCQSHQAKIEELKKEHDRLSDQFRADCTAEYLKVPPTLSPKCAEEQKKMNDAWQRLQAEQAKQ